MRGFRSDSYGDAFADVYDDWYADITDLDTTVGFVADLAGPDGSVLELGVGTGRLAIPLAARVARVVGIDTSARMLDHLARADDAGTVVGVQGDMVDDLPDGPFDVVLAAYNTVFNLTTAERQCALFERVADRLPDGGRFVVEAFVPRDDPDHPRGSQVTVRSMTVDSVVLSASVHDSATQTAEGQFVEITESGGVRLRPWSIRWADPAELDAMAAAAGFVVSERWGDYDRRPFHGGNEATDGHDDSRPDPIDAPASDRHVTVYTCARNPGRVRTSLGQSL
ncbi:MAG: class I SAM-dependent methyltransferase [Acidimicrobiales bacterium]